MVSPKIRLGDALIEMGVLTEEQLLTALNKQKETKKHLGIVLKELLFITDDDIASALSKQLSLPKVDFVEQEFSFKSIHIVPEDFSKRHKLIVIDEDETNMITVAMADPLNILAIDEIELMTNKLVYPVVGIEYQIIEEIDKQYSANSVKNAVEVLKKNVDIIDIKEEILDVENAPIVKLVDNIFYQAAQKKVSDIHIEPYEEFVKIRFRINGDLIDFMNLGKETQEGVITRIKIISKMNIAERRNPQDGRMEISIKDKNLDLRVSTLPTIYGEKIVIRILDGSNFIRKKEEFKLSDDQLAIYNNMLDSSNGIILITGPTGSGKSTTMYSMLHEINNSEKNIVTIEDPVEYRMQGVNQTQVNTRSGYTFSSGLRSILRQDPDTIIVGEIRDKETAKIAIRAAITGHVVISTLHTNSAISTINRLIDMGIEPYLISSSLVGIVSQVLVKQLCDFCKEPVVASKEDKDILGISSQQIIYQAVGCKYCNNGIYDRRNIMEILKLDDGARKLISSKAQISEIKDYYSGKGFKTLENLAKELVLEGNITMKEYIRVSQSVEA